VTIPCRDAASSNSLALRPEHERAAVRASRLHDGAEVASSPPTTAGHIRKNHVETPAPW
jgi:hypothetical protein